MQSVNPDKVGVVSGKTRKGRGLEFFDTTVVTYLSESYKSDLVEIHLTHEYLGIPLI